LPLWDTGHLAPKLQIAVTKRFSLVKTSTMLTFALFVACLTAIYSARVVSIPAAEVNNFQPSLYDADDLFTINTAPDMNGAQLFAIIEEIGVHRVHGLRLDKPIWDERLTHTLVDSLQSNTLKSLWVFNPDLSYATEEAYTVLKAIADSELEDLSMVGFSWEMFIDEDLSPDEHLDGNLIGVELQRSSLTHLEIRNCYGIENYEDIVERLPSSLVSLKVSVFNDLMLSSLLLNMPVGVVSLDLHSQDVTYDGKTVYHNIFELSSNLLGKLRTLLFTRPNVKSLSLNHVKISSVDMKLLGEALQSSHLESFTLTNRDFGKSPSPVDSDIDAIIKAVSARTFLGTTLKTLVLSNCGISRESFKALGRVIPFSKIQSLDVSYNLLDMSALVSFLDSVTKRTQSKLKFIIMRGAQTVRFSYRGAAKPVRIIAA
jgi:hypothetical protein